METFFPQYLQSPQLHNPGFTLQFLHNAHWHSNGFFLHVALGHGAHRHLAGFSLHVAVGHNAHWHSAGFFLHVGIGQSRQVQSFTSALPQPAVHGTTVISGPVRDFRLLASRNLVFNNLLPDRSTVVSEFIS